MKISLNWAQGYSNVPLNEVGTDELVRKIGAQLGAVEGVWQSGDKYNGIVVAKIVSCEKHADADKLNVCMIDDGGVAQDVERNADGLVQVVCGAPNARAGLTVAWIPPGAVVPSTFWAEQFKLEAREIRGVVSNGMLASPSELAISDNHDGILEIDVAEVGEGLAKPGTGFKELYGLDDVTIEVENKMFTHRPDCFGVLGVARELAGIQGKAFTSPDWYTQGALEVGDGTVKVKVDTDLVPRFMAVRIDNVKVGPSPIWLQAGLTRVAVKSINNVVDITNYLSYVTGQPLHAYDADKLPLANTLGARMSNKGEKVSLLNGKELELQDENTVVITSGDTVVGIGGVMGGKDTEVDENTTSVIIECASFDMYNIRKTSMKYGLFTDAVTRFNKGQSPLQNMVVLAKAVEMSKELAHGEQNGLATDVHGELPAPRAVDITAEFINQRLGLGLSVDAIATLLRNVEFGVEETDSALQVTAPFWRTDIEIPEDIVEEVGRLYGYDNLPHELPHRNVKPTQKDSELALKQSLRTVLSRAGANEVLTYSFVHGNLFDKVGQNREHAFKLSNAISPELQYYRTSLTPSLLDKVYANNKAGFDSFALFEINKVHYKGEMDEQEPNVPNEDMHLALVVAYGEKSCPAGAAFYQAREYLELIAPDLIPMLTPLQEFDLSTDEWGRQLTAAYDPERSAVVVKEDQIWGVIGEYRVEVTASLKLPAYTAGFEIHTDVLREQLPSYQPLSRFPSVEQDICLRADSASKFQTVDAQLKAALAEVTETDILYTLHAIDVYQKEESTKQITWRVIATSHERTLKAEHVNDLLDKAASMIDGVQRV